jgi:hypothetical protein
MANLRMCVKNAIDFATLTASPTMLSTATIRASNLLIQDRGLVARTVSPIPASQVINWTWNGQGYYINHVMLNRHNLESSALIRVQLFSDIAWTNQIYDSGLIAPYDASSLSDLDWGFDPLGSGIFDAFLGQKFSILYTPRVLAQSGRVTLNDPGNSNGYLEASRLWAGDYMEFTYNPTSLDFQWDELTKQSRQPGGGGLRSDSASVAFRTFDFDISFIDPLQRALLADMTRYAGLRKDIFMGMYPGAGGESERDHTAIVKYTKIPAIGLKGGIMQLSTKISVAEA